MPAFNPLIYVGPSLTKQEALNAIGCDAIVKPPAKQSDIISDITEHAPTDIFLIDGEFHQNLSVWVKEIIYALSIGIKVYGCSSMGALRAAELDQCGMVGYGKIYEYYRYGVTDNDADVAIAFSEDYSRQTIPIVNIIAAHEGKEGLNLILAHSRAIHYSDRTERALEKAIRHLVGTGELFRNQKKLDAMEMLQVWRDLPASGAIPTKKNLSHIFWAQYERDRRINGVCAQHIESHYLLNSPNYAKELWDANNRSLALVVADFLEIKISKEEVAEEILRTTSDIHSYLKDNHLSDSDGMELFIENAKIRKVHKALDSTRARRRGTKPLFDHLRTHNKFKEIADSASPYDDILLNSESFNKEKIEQYLSDKGIKYNNMENYISETGFGTFQELCAAIEKEKL
jgi:hypothetical protein